MRLRKLTHAIGIAVLFGSADAQERIGDDRHFYVPQPLVACSDSIGRTGLAIGGDACLLVAGETRFAVGYDSSAGLVGFHSELLNATGVFASDVGPTFGVITLRNEGGWPEDTSFSIDEGLSLYELYLAVGEDDFRLTIGKAPTVVVTKDDRALDWLGGGYGRGVSFPAQNDGTFPLTATALQVTAKLDDRLSLAAAYEVGATEQSFWGPDPTGARLVGIVGYDDGITNARLTIGRFDGTSTGEADWSGRLLIGSVIAESFRLLAVGSFGRDQGIDVMLSGSAQLGRFELAGTVHEWGGNGYDQSVALSGSATGDVAAGVAIRVGVMTIKSDYSEDRQIALGAVFDPYENLALDLEAGSAEGDSGSLLYGRASADWHITDLAKAKVAATATSDGGYKIESEFITSLR